MSILQKVLAMVLFFVSAVYAIATPEEAEAGKVKGYTGPGSVAPNGDYLTGTFCYCEYPSNIEPAMGPAHWYQFEYYNIHHNITYILTSSCPDGDMNFDRYCVPSSKDKVEAMEIIAGYTMDKTCKLWKGYEDVGDHHFMATKAEFCYRPDQKHGDDHISFNNQKRNLGLKGRQEKFYIDGEGPCEQMCRDQLEMPVLTNPLYPKSHQILWRLDDMCEDCE